jgi:hypothetical protein
MYVVCMYVCMYVCMACQYNNMYVCALSRINNMYDIMAYYNMYVSCASVCIKRAWHNTVNGNVMYVWLCMYKRNMYVCMACMAKCMYNVCSMYVACMV